MFPRVGSAKQQLSSDTKPAAPENNPIAKSYSDFQYLTNGGSHSLWQIFRAVSQETGKEGAVFFFDKRKSLKINPKLGRPGRQSLVDLLRWEIKVLSMLNHPRILCLRHSAEECSESIAFATEPVLQCLASVFQKKQNMQVYTALPLHIVEIKCGLLQDVFPGYAWNPRLPLLMQPSLSFMAPELQNSRTATTGADIFSLGALVFYIHANGVSVIPRGTTCVLAYSKELDKAEMKVDNFEMRVDPSLRDALLRMLSRDLERRPTSQLFTLIKYFDDTGASALRQLDDMQRLDTGQRSHFLCNTLKESLPFIPEDLWTSRVLPLVETEIDAGDDLSNAAIRPILYMFQHCTTQRLPVFQLLIRRFVMDTSGEQDMLTGALIEHLDVLFRRINDEELLKKLLDLCVCSLKSQSKALKISALRGLPKIRKYLSVSFFSDKFLPNLEACLSEDGVEVSGVEASAFHCCEQLLPAMDSASLSRLLDMICSRNPVEPEVPGAICKLVERLLMESGRMGLGVMNVAQRLVPSLSPLVTIPNLSQAQIKQVIDTERDCLNFIEETELYGRAPPSDRLRTNQHRPQRHSIAGPQVVPQVFVTGPRTPTSDDHTAGSFASVDVSAPRSNRRSSIANNMKLGQKCSESFDSADPDYSRRKSAADIPAWLLGTVQRSRISSTTSLQTNSSPGTPNTRRHSDFGPTKPSTLSNLGHNLACTLWKK